MSEKPNGAGRKCKAEILAAATGRKGKRRAGFSGGIVHPRCFLRRSAEHLERIGVVVLGSAENCKKVQQTTATRWMESTRTSGFGEDARVGREEWTPSSKMGMVIVLKVGGGG
jgi:hypothetical protein